MNKLTKFSLIILFSFLFQNIRAVNDSTKVLFIGNSITYVNNMPQMFQNIANDKGKAVHVESHTVGGSGIVDHYVNAQLYKLINAKKWDIVILQPGSSESAGVSYPVSTTASRAQQILDSIYANSPCAKVFLYEIPYGIPTNGGYPKYFQVQSMIRDSVKKMSDLLQVQMLPAGESFRAYYSLYQNLLLHGSVNDIHPNVYGSYLVASTFYTGVFQDSVSGCTYYSSIPKDTAEKFFTMVDSVVLKNKSAWNINTYNLHSDFTFTQNARTFNFINTSTNYKSSLWKFGDGNTSTVNNPSHTYAQDGNYTVALYAIDQKNCMDSNFVSIHLNTTGFSSDLDCIESFNVFPNPASDFVIVDLPKTGYLIRVFDLNGRIIYKNETPVNASSMRIDLSQYKKGIYFLSVYDSKGCHTLKIMKK